MREHLTILDFSDREFLLVLNDVADDQGWSLAADMAAQLDVSNVRNVSSRLSWLVRFGAVEREQARDHTGSIRTTRDGKTVYTQRWRMTEPGRALAFGKIKATQQRTLDNFDDTQLLLVTRWLSERTRADGVSARLATREWKYGHGRA